MKKLCFVFVLFSITNMLLYSAGKADDAARLLGKALSKEALKTGAQKTDDAIRYATSHAGDWAKAVSSKLDNIPNLLSRRAPDIAKAGIKRGDDVIYDFTRIHRKHIVDNKLAANADNAAVLTRYTNAVVQGLKNTADLVKNGIKTGGYYGELKGGIKAIGQPGTLAVHHMPAQSAIKGANLWNGDIGKAPAIIMDKADHLKTASHGFSKSAKEFQNIQQNLLKQGKFADALQMDVDDLIAKGLYQKYEAGINQMMEYIQALRSNGEL